MPISFGTDLGSSLEEELQALYLQNLINSQMPMPGYDVYGLPGKGGEVPMYSEAPRPAPPNPQVALALQKLAEAQSQRAQGGFFGAQAAAVTGAEERAGKVFGAEEPYLERGAELDWQNRLLERKSAFTKDQARTNVLLNALQEKDPRWRAMNMAMGLGQPSPQLPEDAAPGQRFSAIGKMGETELLPLVTQYQKLMDNISSEGYSEEDKKQMRHQLGILEAQISAIRDYYINLMGGGGSGRGSPAPPPGQFTQQSGRDSMSELNAAIGRAWGPRI